MVILILIAINLLKNTPKPKVNISKQESTLNLKTNYLINFSLGHKRLISSLYWISTVLESDIEHYNKNDLNNWMYIRFKTISTIDPLFYLNYTFGGLYLSVIKDDLEGATDIFTSGLKIYPDDFKLLRDSAFHFYYEVGDKDLAYPLLKKLERHPKTPASLVSLLARMENEKGNSEIALKILENRLLSIDDKTSILYRVLRDHIYSIQAEIDLKCLNRIKKNCKNIDYFGEPYVFLKGEYRSTYKWSRFISKTRSPKK